MTPSAAPTLLSESKCEGKMTVDCNQNEVRSSNCAKRPASTTDLNERSRKSIKKCFGNLTSNLNVLVIGPKESGKSSLINSMYMALAQEWKDRAKYFPGKNHTIDQCVMFRTRGSRNASRSKVVFWDTRGFEDIHSDEHAALILRYVMEGRIPSQCIPCVLLMEKELIKKRYQKTASPERRIDLVLNVAALSQEPHRLMSLVQQAITSSKMSSVNRIPVLSVATKSDTLTEEQMEGKLKRLHEYDLEYLVEEQRHQNHASARRRHPTSPESGSNTKLIVNYCCELEPWSDESLDPSSVQPSTDLDAKLLSLWRDIVRRTAACGGSDRRKRLYSASNSHSFLRCFSFRFPYSRLRSHSF